MQTIYFFERLHYDCAQHKSMYVIMSIRVVCLSYLLWLAITLMPVTNKLYSVCDMIFYLFCVHTSNQNLNYVKLCNAYIAYHILLVNGREHKAL